MEPRDKNPKIRGVGMSEQLPWGEQTFLPLREVLSLQSLAMGVVREQARRQTSKEKMTGYVLFDNSRDSIGSGTVDTYLGVIARRPSFEDWQFTISFLSMVNTHELRYSNVRELNRFNWNRRGNCIGTKVITDNCNPVIDTRVDLNQGLIDIVDPRGSSAWRPLAVEDCDELANRMLETAAQIDPTWQKDAA